MSKLLERATVGPDANDRIDSIVGQACFAAAYIHTFGEVTAEQIDKAEALAQAIYARCKGNRVQGTPMTWGEWRSLFAAMLREAARIVEEGVG